MSQSAMFDALVPSVQETLRECGQLTEFWPESRVAALVASSEWKAVWEAYDEAPTPQAARRALDVLAGISYQEELDETDDTE